MRIIAPDYYPKFSCLMGACRHSCCIGWEIDIDEESLGRFYETDGEIGRELRENIVEADGCASFRLCKDERCPFLNADGLCRLIIELGEDSLCQICADHPRFRNFFSDREEIGLGLCCEAAAQLVLKNSQPAIDMVLKDDGLEEETDPEEQDLLQLRRQLIQILQDRGIPVQQRIQCMLQQADISLANIDMAAWTPFFLTLERLDEAWTQKLNMISGASSPLPCSPEWELAWEQLAVYLLQRHLPGALDDGDITGRIAFAALAIALLGSLCMAQLAQQGDISIDDLCELARMFSSEIEYSDENIGAILDELHRVYPEL